MRKLYLTYNDKESKREYYTYSSDSNNPVYITLKESETEVYLKYLLGSKLKSARSINDNLLEIANDDTIVVIDNKRVFQNSDNLDSYFTSLSSSIKECLENSNIARYKSSLPNGYKPKVNRHRNDKKRYIIDDNSLATNLILSSGYQKIGMDLQDIEMYNSELEKGR